LQIPAGLVGTTLRAPLCDTHASSSGSEGGVGMHSSFVQQPPQLPQQQHPSLDSLRSSLSLAKQVRVVRL